MKVKLVCISDTHGMHSKIGKLPAGDILIHAGDFSSDLPPLGEVEDLVFFNRWLEKQPYQHKILIAGNHDFICQEDSAISKKIITHAVYLQDSGIEVNGLKFWGMPWTPIFMNWAFMANGKEMKRYTEMIPDDIDVLITHGPPHGIMDQVGKVHVGSKELLQAVKRVNPKAHIFGHIHEGHGIKSIHRTVFVNACALDEWYEPVNKPMVVQVSL